jgi:hypothetical protein
MASVTGLVRETWILIGFVVLAGAALLVAAAGVVHLIRGRKAHMANPEVRS